MMEKLDIIMSTFFSEVGNDLIIQLSSVNKHKADTSYLESIKSWDGKDYENKLKEIKNINIPFRADVTSEDREEYLTNIRNLLINKREFIVGLLNNPNLLEKEEFSKLLTAILHLDEELEHRPDLSKVTDVDFNHLNGDMERIYNILIHEWIYYLRYLNKHYPYMIALIIRTNPFDANADAYVKE